MKNGILNAFRRLNSLVYKSKDRIAVIIPVYNVTSFLEEAIRSAISQNYLHKEVIVVDDGSSEEHAEEIRRICGLFSDVTLLRQQHIGAASARDKGVLYSSAELILFLDADDILLPGSLQYFSDATRNNPDAVATYARVLIIDENGDIMDKPVRPASMVSGRKLLYSLLDRDICLYNGAVCIRRNALNKLSPNNHNLILGEDWVLWCHLALSGNIVPAGERIVLHCRNHKKNITGTLLDQTHLLFTTYDIVFMDPMFIAAVGAGELRTLREKCVCGSHLHLASLYAEQSKLQEARFHLEKANMPLSALFDTTST